MVLSFRNERSNRAVTLLETRCEGDIIMLSVLKEKYEHLDALCSIHGARNVMVWAIR